MSRADAEEQRREAEGLGAEGLGAEGPEAGEPGAEELGGEGPHREMPGHAPAANQFGRPSELRLVAEARNGHTVLADEYYTMPFKVMLPLSASPAELLGYGSAGGNTANSAESSEPASPIQVMVMSTSAGVMAGDNQRIDICVGSNAALVVTTQAFEKVHRMDAGSSARRTTRLKVAGSGYLDYRPQPQIPFADSAYAASTEIDLADPTARLVYEEVLSCGRAARGERFAYRGYQNHVAVRVGGTPVYLDNTVYVPSGDESRGIAPMPMESMGFYEGFTHLANLVLVNLNIGEAPFMAARDHLRELTGIIGASAQLPASAGEDSEAVAGGITRLASGDVAVRLLGRRAQRLTDVLQEVRRIISSR